MKGCSPEYVPHYWGILRGVKTEICIQYADL